MEREKRLRYRRIAATALAVVCVAGAVGFSVWSISKGDNSHADMSNEQYDDVTLDGHFEGEPGHVRYICTDGSHLTGWQVLYGSIYHFDEDGYRTEGDATIHGVEYRFMPGTGKLMQNDDGSSWVMDRGDAKPVRVDAPKSDGDTVNAMLGERDTIPKSEMGYMLPKSYKDPDVEKPDIRHGDWYGSMSEDEVMAEVLSKTVWADVVTGEVFHGADGLKFAFKDAGTGDMGGLRLVSNPYGATFSFPFTGERAVVTSSTDFDVFWDDGHGFHGKLSVAAPERASDASDIDTWYN